MLPLKVEIKMFKSHENRAEWWVPTQGREFECTEFGQKVQTFSCKINKVSFSLKHDK